MSISDFHALHRDSGMEYAFVSTTYHNYIINSVINLNNADSRDFLSGKVRRRCYDSFRLTPLPCVYGYLVHLLHRENKALWNQCTSGRQFEAKARRSSRRHIVRRRLRTELYPMLKWAAFKSVLCRQGRKYRALTNLCTSKCFRGVYT